MKIYCWRPEKICRFESFWSLLRKFAFLNQIRLSAAWKLASIPKLERQPRFANTLHIKNINDAIVDYWPLDRLNMERSTVEYYCGQHMHRDMVEGGYLRFCPQCLKQGYHSPIYQLKFLPPYCPIHQVAYELEPHPFGNKFNAIEQYLWNENFRPEQLDESFKRLDLVVAKLDGMKNSGVLQYIYPLITSFSAVKTGDVFSRQVSALSDYLEESGKQTNSELHTIEFKCGVQAKTEQPATKYSKKALFKSYRRYIQKKFLPKFNIFNRAFAHMLNNYKDGWPLCFKDRRLSPLVMGFIVWKLYWENELDAYRGHEHVELMAPNILPAGFKYIRSNNSESEGDGASFDLHLCGLDLQFSLLEFVEAFKTGNPNSKNWIPFLVTHQKPNGSFYVSTQADLEQILTGVDSFDVWQNYEIITVGTALYVNWKKESLKTVKSVFLRN
jgi:hypothetical protein